LQFLLFLHLSVRSLSQSQSYLLFFRYQLTLSLQDASSAPSVGDDDANGSVGLGLGRGVVRGFGRAVGLVLGLGVGRGVGRGVGLGVGRGVGLGVVPQWPSKS
jgi:hypothetical protein